MTSGIAVAGGFTSARCWSVVLDDGQRVFVKVAADDDSVVANRTEALVLKTAASNPLPRLIGISDDGAILATDDLSHADWSVQRFEADFWRAVETIGSLEAPDTLYRVYQGDGRESWSIVAADDRFTLVAGLDPRWFDAALPMLIDASRAADTSGSRLVHGDLAPGNWCRESDSAWRFVDWAQLISATPSSTTRSQPCAYSRAQDADLVAAPARPPRVRCVRRRSIRGGVTRRRLGHRTGPSEDGPDSRHSCELPPRLGIARPSEPNLFVQRHLTGSPAYERLQAWLHREHLDGSHRTCPSLRSSVAPHEPVGGVCPSSSGRGAAPCCCAPFNT